MMEKIDERAQMSEEAFRDFTRFLRSARFCGKQHEKLRARYPDR